MIGYADESTLLAVVPSRGAAEDTDAEDTDDLGRVSEKCDLWGMKLILIYWE